MTTRFPLGSLLITPAALRFAGEQHIDVFDVLLRHARGDWSEMTLHDQRANEQAVLDGARVFSSYTFTAGKLWVVTEWDRSVTTVLLPQDY